MLGTHRIADDYTFALSLPFFRRQQMQRYQTEELASSGHTREFPPSLHPVIGSYTSQEHKRTLMRPRVSSPEKNRVEREAAPVPPGTCDLNIKRRGMSFDVPSMWLQTNAPRLQHCFLGRNSYDSSGCRDWLIHPGV